MTLKYETSRQIIDLGIRILVKCYNEESLATIIDQRR